MQMKAIDIDDWANAWFKAFKEIVNFGECDGPSFLNKLYSGNFLYFFN